MRRLNGILVRNRVKRELKLGEYYEKPSERKKRLAVERHRRRFQDLVSFVLLRECVGRG
jgi:ribosomal protein S21